MKRNIGTALLFALLILTVIALKQTDTPSSSAVDTTGSVQQVSARK